MATGNWINTDLYSINNVVQNTALLAPKQFIVGLLRDEYAQDSQYHYVSDQWGFPKVVDLTDTPNDAGVHDDVTTRVYIGEKFPANTFFYPSLLVSMGGISYNPISINRDKASVQNEVLRITDGYNFKTVYIPSAFIFTGAWDGTINIEVMSRGLGERDELTEITMLLLMDIRYEELLRAGVGIKKVSAGAPSEVDDRNGNLYKQTITADVRMEWRRQIPIDGIIEAIKICVDFSYPGPYGEQIVDPNIEIRTDVTLLDTIAAL